MEHPWQIELLGRLRASQPDRVLTRFQTRKTGVLLAYLACYRERPHPREELVELLWPECDPAAGRHRLCQALYSLRRQLEPPGVPPGAVLIANRQFIQLNPAAAATDVGQFEAALLGARRASSPAERIQRLIEAVQRYQGEFLPGYFEEWVLPERQRLADACRQALQDLAASLEEEGDLAEAIQWARRAITIDRLCEESHCLLIRLLIATGQREAARRQYAELEQFLATEAGTQPAPETRALLEAPEATARGSEARSTNSPKPRREEASPPPGGAPAPPGQLPLQFTRFFGREAEIARLGEWLRAPESRLVTLTGPGGTGKTRLAIEAGRQLQAGGASEERARSGGPDPGFAGGVWFVPLLDLADPPLIPNRIRDALRLPRSPEIEPLEQVVAFLSRQPALLVLDNFEHLVEQGTEWPRTLMARVEGLTLLVTSRRSLELEGEQVFPVEPLPVPGVGYWVLGVGTEAARPNTQHPIPNTLLSFPSVRLFVDRAQAVRPDFQVTPANAAAVAALCTRLEGLPLAIELGAGRAGVLTPEQMLVLLEERFELLRGRRMADPRHRSLRATLDWSYQLLTPELQRFFRQLAAFRGSWALEAAEKICEADGAALEYLDQLRENSLVLAEEQAGAMRYRLLETLREYGASQCTPEEWTDLARRHAAYYLTLAEQGEAELSGPHSAPWLQRLESDHANLLAALHWLEQTRQIDTALRLAGALWRFWFVSGHWILGHARLTELLAQVADDTTEAAPTDEPDRTLMDAASEPGGAPSRTAVRAKALHGAGVLTHYYLIDLAGARDCLEQSLALWRRQENPRGIAEALDALAMLGDRQWDWETAAALREESLQIWRELNDPGGIARSLRHLANQWDRQGPCAAARALLDEALTLSRQSGDREAEVELLTSLAGMSTEQGDWKTARALLEESLAVQRESGNRSHIETLCLFGWVALRQDDYTLARSSWDEVLAIDLQRINRGGAVLLWLGHLADLQGDAAAARDWYRQFLEHHEEREHRHTLGWCAEAHLALGDLDAREGEPISAQARYRQSLLRFRQTERAEGIVACLEKLAAIAYALGQPQRAARLFGAVEALYPAAPGWGPFAVQPLPDPGIAAAHAALAREDLAPAWAEGRAMTLDQAIVDALEGART